MMLMRYSMPLRFQKQVVAADVIVMPRSCSCSIQSIVAAPSCTSPILWVLPGVVEDALGRRRLPGIDVGHDADVPIVVERCCAWHVYQVSLVASLVSDPKISFSKNAGGPCAPVPGPVSIRCRRVHSPLLREWGPKGAPSDARR